MANEPAQVGSNGPPTQEGKKKPLLPPEEKFWQRYSAHHEAPLSGFSSLFLHVLVIGLVAGIAIWLGRSMREKEEPLPLDALLVDAGGGGQPDGADDGTGRGKRQEDVGPKNNTPTPAAEVPKPQEVVPQVVADNLNIPDLNSDDKRLIEENKETFEKLNKAGSEVSQKLIKGLASNNPAPKGRGGDGEGGGKGNGVGKGEGDGVGTGGRLNQRQKRQIRWHLTFNTRGGGSDYLRQLASLGAILAVPEPSGQFRIIHDLRQSPARGEIEDIATIKRIFWVDSDRDSVQSLAVALGLRGNPPYIAAFFPQELEDQLLKLELAYAGKREDQIRETRFHLKAEPGGRYVPFVVHQR